MTQDKTAAAGRAAAAQAREDKSVRHRQQEAQATAGEISNQMAGISPTVAAQGSVPLDTTQGFDFTPGARPQDLPIPGQAPSGAEGVPQGPERFDGGTMASMMEQQAVGAAGGLVDDHDALVGAGIGGGGDQPPGAPPAPPQAAQEPRIHKAPEVEHPILASLRQDLGIDAIHPKDCTVGGHKWTMHTLAPGDLATAARLADQISGSMTERHMVYQTSVVAHAVIAIDDVPTYQVFDVEPPPGVSIPDHLRPPRQVKFLAAVKLFYFLNDSTRTELPAKLYAAYEDKCDISGGVESYLDDPTGRRVRFRCPEDECDHEIYSIPRYVPGKRDIVIPFCQWHATPMELVGVQEELNRPLA